MKRIAVSMIMLAAVFVLAGCTDNSEEERSVKQEIVVACGKDATGTLAEVMQEFTAQSETTQVKLLEFSNESIELHRVLASMLAGQEVQLDAMLIEDVWVGEFFENEYLLPLCSIGEFDAEAYPAGIDRFVGDEEKLYWYPMILDTGIMYYREDLTDRARCLDVIAEGNKGTYAIQGADGEEMLCCALEFINLEGSAREGLALYKRALRNSVSRNTNYLTEFKNGNAVYMRSWASDSRGVISGFSSVKGRVDADVMVDSENNGYAISRAYGYSVNKFSERTESCMELLEYLKSDAVQMKILKGTGTLPLKREYYKNPVILDYTNYTDDAERLFDSLNFRPARSNYTYVSREARAALNEYIENDGSLDAAAAAFERLLDIRQ